VADAGLVTVIIGLAVSLVLIVIGSSFKRKIQLQPDRQTVGHDMVRR